MGRHITLRRCVVAACVACSPAVEQAAHEGSTHLVADAAAMPFSVADWIAGASYQTEPGRVDHLDY